MKDMQDVYLKVFESFGYKYPPVKLSPDATRMDPACIYVRPGDSMIFEPCRVEQILFEGLGTPVGFVEEAGRTDWELCYNPKGAKDVPLQFLKIFEIFIGFPSPKIEKASNLATIGGGMRGFPVQSVDLLPVLQQIAMELKALNQRRTLLERFWSSVRNFFGKAHFGNPASL